MTMSDLCAPYTSQDLFLTKTFDDEFATILVERGGKEGSPFPRKIDLWWTAVMVGVAIGHPSSRPSRDKLIKFETGAIFGQQPWRVTHLELMALAEQTEGDELKPIKPNTVVGIAHEYAFTGLDWIGDEVRGSAQPMIKLMTALERFLS